RQNRKNRCLGPASGREYKLKSAPGPNRVRGSPMNRTYRIWYLLALLLALAPVGARLLLWRQSPSQDVDPAMARAGEVLFKHDWKPNDPLSPQGAGLGPVYNASSCVACHHQAGPGGGGGLEHNVTTFTVRIPGREPRQGVVHSRGVSHRET